MGYLAQQSVGIDLFSVTYARRVHRRGGQPRSRIGCQSLWLCFSSVTRSVLDFSGDIALSEDRNLSVLSVYG